MFLFIFIFLICFLYSSEIKVYFTSPNNTPSIENPFKSIDFALKEFIDSANFGDTIYLCIYQINNSTITLAIDDAVRRKVKVYAIFDDKTSLDLFKTNFERKKMPSDIVMHNKFVVLKSSKVWSGSYNFTVSATYSQNNFALEIFSKELAEIYEKAFLCMWGYSIDLSEFNGVKISLKDNSKITVYFNPFQQNPQLKDILINLFYDQILDVPKISSVYFAYTFFTLNEIIDVFKKMCEKGVKIEGILDDTSENFYAYNLLRNSGACVEFDKNYSNYLEGVMHHKFCVVDAETENSFVICGSANLSNSGLTTTKGNYENVMVIESSSVSKMFYEEFLKLKQTPSKQQIISDTILITEVAMNEPSYKDWIELFVLKDGYYGGWQIWSGYPKKKIAELPDRFYSSGEFVLINLNNDGSDRFEENLLIINSKEEINLYTTEGFIILTKPDGRWVDAVGWSNRDGSLAKEASMCYYELKNNMMWKDNIDFLEIVNDIDIQNSLVDISNINKYPRCSIQRTKDFNCLPKDTNSLEDWFFSNTQTKGFGYKKVISATNKLIEVDKTTNPFSPEDKINNFVKINFNIPDQQAVKTIIVYDISGREIIKLVDKDKGINGEQLYGLNKGSVIWDGKDRLGCFVKSGIYLVFIEGYNPRNGDRYFSKDLVVVYRK